MTGFQTVVCFVNVKKLKSQREFIETIDENL